MVEITQYALSGRQVPFMITQGAALGYELLPFQGVWVISTVQVEAFYTITLIILLKS